MKISKATAFETENGNIELYTSSGKYIDPDGEEQPWETLDIVLVTADGVDETLCCLEYNSDSGLTLKVFDPDKTDPVLDLPIDFSKESAHDKKIFNRVAR